MNRHYEDILSRINEEPLWFDEHAVPRYCDFSPNEIANIYAEECVLMLIVCQNCETEFKVAMSFYKHDRTKRFSESVIILDSSYREAPKSRIRLHYGDPPNIGCCAPGPTMNSVPMKVIEFWSRASSVSKTRDWIRVPNLELDVDCDW